ncbi:MAG TPA: SDR family NAD(P)-dependent oxidoreductase [Stellaceae bacterium]|nr:SDR family NAD(P)-dependent oxidoreductase [Stellaceae bacterium]
MTAGKGQRLQGRIALVTGASRGLGAAIAKRFASEGAHLILVARTQGGLEELDDEIRAAGGEAATLLPLDLRELDKIDQMGAAISQRFGRLDVLVGNAAVLGTLSPLGHIEPKVWEEVLATNLTANWRLIRSLDPLLRRSDAGRAIFVTCSAARTNTAYWGAYAASKAALEAMVRIYADELGITKATANLVDPGILATKLRAKGFPGEDKLKVPKPEDATEAFVALAEAGSQANGEIVGLTSSAAPSPGAALPRRPRGAR